MRAEAGPQPPVVETLVVTPRAVRDAVDLLGQLDTADSVLLKPEISGVVARVVFEEGEPVRRGVPLVYLRDAEQRARLAEARARLDLSRSGFERAQALANRAASSQADLDQARAEFEMAKARFDLAKVELDRTVIRAPFDGVMGAKLVSPGERVSPGGERGPSAGGGGEPTGIGRIEALDRMELVFTLPETVLPLARTGVRLELQVAAFPGETFPGEVFFVDPRINEVNRRGLVKARVPNPEHKLKPGMFAKLQVVVAQREAALMVPEDAVMYEQDGTSVWRLHEGSAERVPVRLGIRLLGEVEVTNGLRPGDEIVISGTHKVAPGKPVRAVPPGSSDASAREERT